MESHSYTKPQNTVMIHVVSQCRQSFLTSRFSPIGSHQSALTSRKNIVETLPARLPSLLPVRLAELLAHDAEINVPLNHADEWHAQLEQLVEGNLFLRRILQLLARMDHFASNGSAFQGNVVVLTRFRIPS
jgi:hypothetical protein